MPLWKCSVPDGPLKETTAACHPSIQDASITKQCVFANPDCLFPGSRIDSTANVYSLCALLGDSAYLKSGPAEVPGTRVIDLHGSLAMVPLSEALLREIQREWGGSQGSTRIQGVFEFLTPPVERWVRAISEGSALAYIETEYFGGEGFERSAVFRDSQVVLGPLDGAGAINGALRALGVAARPGQEEFDVVGLGRHRSLEEWLSEA